MALTERNDRKLVTVGNLGQGWWSGFMNWFWGRRPSRPVARPATKVRRGRPIQHRKFMYGGRYGGAILRESARMERQPYRRAGF